MKFFHLAEKVSINSDMIKLTSFSIKVSDFHAISNFVVGKAYFSLNALPER